MVIYNNLFLDLLGRDEQALLSHLSTIQKLSRGTIITRRSRIRIFLAWLEDQPINKNTVQDFIYYLKEEKELSNTTLNTYLRALISLQIFMKSLGHKEKFMKGFTFYEEEDPNIIPLSNTEVRQLRSRCLQPHANLLTQTKQDLTIFHTDTGARWEDAQIFKCKSVDIIGSEITYIEKKTKRLRSLPITEPLLSILTRRIKGKKPDSLVFENSVGNIVHYPDYYIFLQNLAQDLGIVKRMSPHNIRRSFGQNSYDSTGDILLTQKLFNHKRIETTLRYVKTSKNQLKQAQESHPHLDLPPERIVERIENLIDTTKIENLKQFNKIKVKLAKSKFIMELYEAIV